MTRGRLAAAAWLACLLSMAAFAVPADAQPQVAVDGAQAARVRHRMRGSWKSAAESCGRAGSTSEARTPTSRATRPPAPDPTSCSAAGTRIGSGLGLAARVSVYLSPRLSVEGGLRVTRPKLSVTLSGDAEDAANQVAEETLSQYVVDGSALWHFGDVQRSKIVPFAGGGAGYMRDVHEGSDCSRQASSITGWRG